MREKGKSREEEWNELFARWSRSIQLADQWNRWMAGAVPEDVDEVLGMFSPGEKVATRAASGKVLNTLAAKIRNLWRFRRSGTFNNTYLEGMGDVRPDDFRTELQLRCASAMGAIVNGISSTADLGCSVQPSWYSVTMRPAIRLAALMKLPVVFVLTHDSVYVGEDGPTPAHQHRALRLIPT